jgi:hypothetical protein
VVNSFFMDPDARAKIEQGLRLARRIDPEHRLDAAFAQHTKTALRRAAMEKGIDLGLERVSLWREAGASFEHLGSTRTIYLAFREADHYQEEIFVFDAIGGEALTFLTRPPEPED